jgi:leucyl/phenylalanyl-tRNA--protein transferase
MEVPVQFPDPKQSGEHGLVAVGGELSPDYLLSAYAQGIFPWFSVGEPILWWSLDPRMVLFPDQLKVSKSLRQVIRSGKFEIRIDTSFEKVIKQCSKIERKAQDGTWITEDMIKAYTRLHELGYAHSFETYHDRKLVGGLYGVSLGKAFFGESMFFLERDASKFALYHLVNWCLDHDFHFIDVQQSTTHMKSLGATDIPRSDFLKRLKRGLEFETVRGKWG